MLLLLLLYWVVELLVLLLLPLNLLPWNLLSLDLLLLLLLLNLLLIHAGMKRIQASEGIIRVRILQDLLQVAKVAPSTRVERSSRFDISLLACIRRLITVRSTIITRVRRRLLIRIRIGTLMLVLRG